MEDYKVYTISFYPFNLDIVSGMLWSLSIDGITEEENNLKVYSKLSSGITTKNIEVILDKLIEQNLLESFEITEGTEHQQNWNEYWESRLNIIHVTDRITIKPTTKEYAGRDDEVVITIDPKMSFGTGEHETTKLCIAAIEKNTKADNLVLDLGSGTGVLAIAAAKLGASKVYAVDNDEWCLENGKENALLNSVEDKVETILGDISVLDYNSFDIAVANINKNVLTELGAELAQRIKSAGKLIVSGFYKSDSAELTDYYTRYYFTKLEETELNNWCSITFVRL